MCLLAMTEMSSSLFFCGVPWSPLSRFSTGKKSKNKFGETFFGENFFGVEFFDGNFFGGNYFGDLFFRRNFFRRTFFRANFFGTAVGRPSGLHKHRPAFRMGLFGLISPYLTEKEKCLWYNDCSGNIALSVHSSFFVNFDTAKSNWG